MPGRSRGAEGGGGGVGSQRGGGAFPSLPNPLSFFLPLPLPFRVTTQAAVSSLPNVTWVGFRGFLGVNSPLIVGVFFGRANA